MPPPTHRFKSPPRSTGPTAAAPAGGTRLGEGLAEPRQTPRRGHTVARLSPATPPRLRHADGPRLSRSGGYAVVGSRPIHRPATVCRTPLSTPEATPLAFDQGPTRHATLHRVGGPAACRRKKVTPLSSRHHNDDHRQHRSRLRTTTTRNATAITRRFAFAGHSTPQRKGTPADGRRTRRRTSRSTNRAAPSRLRID